MKQRIEECRRALKDTGSIFVHCDSSASHHLRLILDGVFGPGNFQSEIIWVYRRWSNTKRGLLNAHQSIYFYSKTGNRLKAQADLPLLLLRSVAGTAPGDGRGSEARVTNHERKSIMSNRPAILAEGLHKYYGKTRALAGLDLVAEEGSVLALLGPNGAGKTTAVRILTTLLRPDAGRAEVAGLDVVKDADALRSRIGLSGQYAAVAENLTGYENLEMFGRLYHLSGSVARRRANELLERFDLVDAARRTVKTYSGGMRRRLDLAGSLIISPQVLFLDEPTTGLDPRGRLAMWEVISTLAASGTTVLLTTQYLEEADHLADQVAVVDLGRVIARGTADELKAQIGGERLELTVARGGDLNVAAQALRPYSAGEIQVNADARQLVVPVSQGTQLLADVVRDLDAVHIPLDTLALRRPTLDDVFLTLTGRAATTGDLPAETPVLTARSTR